MSVISRHISNIIIDGELDAKSNLQKMQIPNSDKPIVLYNLDRLCKLATKGSMEATGILTVVKSAVLAKSLVQLVKKHVAR